LWRAGKVCTIIVQQLTEYEVEFKAIRPESPVLDGVLSLQAPLALDIISQPDTATSTYPVKRFYIGWQQSLVTQHPMSTLLPNDNFR
jgi:hypothetical protein